MFRSSLGALALVAVIAGTASAEDFSSVPTRDGFVSLVSGKALTRFGIRLDVRPDGAIRGRAFGVAVHGDWRWENGYFCRNLFFGEEDLGPNCQVVLVQGDTLRFIADRGNGDHADLRLK